MTLACAGHFHDYSCALEREILWQGTLYVAATHVCFYGKHFGKTVKVIIDYRDLVLIEREKKLGVFPSSIRLRVASVETNPPTYAAWDSQEAKGNTNTNNDDPGAAEPKIPATTKDYVLTSLMNREQAFADIERNWQAHRHFQKNVCNSGLPTPQLDVNGRGTALGLDSRVKPWTILDRHKVPRTYSVISDEAFSSSEYLDRPHLRERASTSLIRPSTSVSHEYVGSWRAAAAVTGAISDHYSQPLGILSSASEGRRGSVASIGSSDKQELTTGLIGFLQRRSSLIHKWKKGEGGGGGNFSDISSDVAQDHREDVSQSPIDASVAATTASTTQSSTLQDSPLLSAQRQDEALRASTPPPPLISPSLTTTKVSRSLPTVQTDAKPGSTHGMTKHIRGKSSNGLQITSDEKDMTPGQAVVAITISNNENTIPGRVLPYPLPLGPVSCGCPRHYKNAVVSTVVPLPVDLCFEILFSGAGAGLGDKLVCDTHRIKDGSTDILIMPWQHEDQPQDSDKVNKSDWVDQQRKLEYSVSFKVPMLTKTSTACFETQRVTQHKLFAILVHSESKTPNVPYGEHFSTVNQICMTWESEGKTRIKCFTEVKFKRSIMWSSKVEAGSLEGSGGFYKEFIRQFEQLVESQREQLLSSYEARKLASYSSSLVSNLVADGSELARTTRACASVSNETLTLTPGHGSSRVIDKIGCPRVTFAVSTFPSASSLPATPRSAESPYFSKDRSVLRQGRQDHDRGNSQQHTSRRLSKVLLGFVILGLAVSALNIWHLFSVVSSMVEVIQLKDDVFQRQFHPLQAPYNQKRRPHSNNPTYRKRVENLDPWRPSSSVIPGTVQQHSRQLSSARTTATTASSFTVPQTPTVHNSKPQKHLLDEALLSPLQIQTAILRMEIIELFDLLEQARKELHHPHHQHHNHS
ncbi:hypothetical protein BG015_004268 [Linnemannia schmuckeri]|uniref:VASt domain-containing protein n=1 Tax=Linnemannia schmuckeri TaxID=64567 RepID=A0A9P5S4H3_9FUNG|nr:hypothetical protein BG015_004268 [Linnemannia schmuckeri]